MDLSNKDASILHLASRGILQYQLDEKDTYLALIGVYMEYFELISYEGFAKLAFLHMKVYLEKGYGYRGHEALFERILAMNGCVGLEGYLKSIEYRCTIVKLSRNQIGYILGKWLISSDRSGTKPEIINAIWNKIKNKELGTYEYYQKRNGRYQYYYLMIYAAGVYMQDDAGRSYKFILPEGGL